MQRNALRTQLYGVHKMTAKLTEFAGFEMPLYYKGIVTEHMAIREDVGIFDISHMGRVVITGADAEAFLNYVITNDVSRLANNSALYSVMCTEKGGIVDDFVIYRLESEKFLMVSNAGNREKDYNWLTTKAQGFNVQTEDVSDKIAMLAVQGPSAQKMLQNISSEDISKVERFKCGHTQLANTEVFLARTGYTGEDGFELFIWNAPLEKPDNAVRIWNEVLKSGKPYCIEPCGLGARDTLRLEAGLCLYGNDIDETTTPLEAGLGFVVKLQKESFIGKDVLQKQKEEGAKRKRVGISLLERGVPRPSFEIYNDNNEKIGNLTSGTFSPLLKRGIGMGYIQISQTQEGEIVYVKIRDKMAKAKITTFPLYDTEKFGYRRKQ